MSWIYRDKNGMFKRYWQSLFLLSVFCFCLFPQAKEYLRPEQAFKISGQLTQQGLQISFDTVAGYYVYQESLQVHSVKEGKNTLLEPNTLPLPSEKYDENFQKIVRTYAGTVVYNFAASRLPKESPLVLEIQVQGCADRGICYPPMTRYLQLMQYDVKVQSQASLADLSVEQSAVKRSWWAAKDDLNALNRLLEKTSTPLLLGVFFLLGLGLAFTPCMLPMLPILSSILFGGGAQPSYSRKKTITIALVYVLGMASAFSLAGMATAWFGAGVSSFLLHPWVVIGFGLLMLSLSASLLGLYELRLPQAWNQMVQGWMHQQRTGNVIGVFMLGALSSLIASPCITAPLAGVLTFIAQSGQVGLGGLILFVLALGMGLPLMLFAIGARTLVPRAGSWMLRVQKILAIVLVFFAMWMIYPAAKTLVVGPQSLTTKVIGGLDYQVVRSVEDFKRVRSEAVQNKQPAFVTYFADWCVSCQEIDRIVLSNDKVKERLRDLQRIEVDVTVTGKEQQALLGEHQLFGPPAFIFIDAAGKEVEELRVVGIISVEKLLEKLRLFSVQ